MLLAGVHPGQALAADPPSVLRQAAEAGVPAAQVALGDALLRGQGLPADRDAAIGWYRKAASLGYPDAMARLGAMQMSGNGIPRDVPAGLDLLRRAAGLGNVSAADLLAHLYWLGGPVPADHAQAQGYLRQAAEGGMPWSQNVLGMILFKGDGVAVNQTEGAAWFRRAAEKGNATAQFNLAAAYLSGAGTERSVVEGAAWLVAATGNADPADQTRFAQIRDKVLAMLSPEDAARAQALAAPRIGKQTLVAPVAPPPAVAGGTAVKTGTGFFVAANGAVLTDLHVVRDCGDIAVKPFGGGGPAAATIIARDSVNDLAVLETRLTPLRVVTLREDVPLRSGDGVVVIGYPLSGLLSPEPNVTSGIISALAGPHGDSRLLQITAPVQKGNSGGALADMSGNVIGVIASKLDALSVQNRFGDLPQNINFATKAQFIRNFLGDYGIAYATAPSRDTLSTADVAERLSKATALVECRH